MAVVVTAATMLAMMFAVGSSRIPLAWSPGIGSFLLRGLRLKFRRAHRCRKPEKRCKSENSRKILHDYGPQ